MDEPIIEKKPTWFETNPKKTLVVLILFFLVLVDLITAKFVLPKTEIEPQFAAHHGLKSNYSGEVKWGAEPVSVQTNSLGMRDFSVRNVPPKSKNYRLLLEGDSFTEGVGTQYPQTFAGIVTTKLAGQNIEVLNAGSSSYSPKLYYLKLKELLEAKHLDVNEVVVFIDLSDVQDELTYQNYNPTKLQFFERQADAWLSEHSVIYAYGFKPLLLKVKSFHLATGAGGQTAVPADYTQAYYDQRALWALDDKVYQAWGQAGVKLEISNMELLTRLCAQHNIKLSLAVYPWPIQLEKGDLNSRQVQIWQDFAKQHNLGFLNLFPTFFNLNSDPKQTEEKYFIPGDVHWNAAGHAVVAEQFLSWYANEH